MRDPFPSKVKAQLVREAQFGFCIVAALLIVFAYVTYNRLSGRDHQLPEHVQNSSPTQEISPPPKESADELVVDASARDPASVLPFVSDRSPPQPTADRIRHDHQVQLASANDSSPFEPAPHEAPVPFQPTAIKPIQDNSFRSSTNSASDTHLKRPPPKTNLRLSVPSGIALRNQLPAISRPPTQRDIALDAISPTKPPSEATPNTFTPLSDKSTTGRDVTIPDTFAPPKSQPSPPQSPNEATHGEDNHPPENESQRKDEHRSSASLDSPVPIAAPAPGRPGGEATVYVTQPGDSFWSIAQSVYEDPRFFRALYQVNLASVPDFENLKPKTKLAIPSREELISRLPDLCPPTDSKQVTRRRPSQTYVENRIYITQSGDTLWEIARQKLGQASRYSEINHWNDTRLAAETLPDTPLPRGIRLVLPVR